MLVKRLAALVLLFAALPAGGTTLDEDVETLAALLRLDEDIRNQYQQCIGGSADMSASAIRREIAETYADVELDGEDLAILMSIYTEFYNQGCDYLDGPEIGIFYRAELRKRFTHEEIRSLIEFYRTPLGLKLNAQWLEINHAFGEILNQRQNDDGFEAQRRLEQRMQDFWDYLERKASEEKIEHGA